MGEMYNSSLTYYKWEATCIYQYTFSVYLITEKLTTFLHEMHLLCIKLGLRVGFFWNLLYNLYTFDWIFNVIEYQVNLLNYGFLVTAP